MTKGTFIVQCKEKFPRYIEGMRFNAINPETNIGLVCTYKSKVSPLCDFKLASLDRDGNADFLKVGE